MVFPGILRACKRVFIVSNGNKIKSTVIPAKPPAIAVPTPTENHGGREVIEDRDKDEEVEEGEEDGTESELMVFLYINAQHNKLIYR